MDAVEARTDDPAVEPESQGLVTLERWELEVPVAASQGMAYIPVRTLCVYLGISSDMQIKRLKQHEIMAKYLRRFMLKTGRGGSQATYCLPQRVVGFWLGSISIGHVREELRSGLLDFQEALIDKANELLLGQSHPLYNGLSPVKAQLTTHEAQIAGVTRFALALEERIGRLEQLDDRGEEK